MAYTMNYDSKKDVAKQYREKLVTADEAVKCIKSGDWVTYGFFNGKPIACDSALARRAGELKDILVGGAVTIPPIPEILSCDPKGEIFSYNDYHYTLLSRIMKMQYPNSVYYCPFNFGEADWECEHLHGPMFDYDPNKVGIRLQDVHIMRVGPMDSNGFFNFGTYNAVSYSWLKAHKVILEVNTNIPTALGGSRESVHISQADYIVESNNEPLFEIPNIQGTDIEHKIAENVFKYLSDGCCIQLGIGGLPNTLGHIIAESDLKNLGGHTEMLGEAYMEMYLSGRMNNSMKNIDRWKTAYTFAGGTTKFYEWIHENKALASYHVGYANHIDQVRAIDNFISINSAIEADINGQVNAESDGFNQISGNGGMFDFVNNSFWSKGGKSIICLPSTHTKKDGTVSSRIVPFFKPGTTVTIPRQSVQFLATEYGCVNLKLCPQWMRTEKIISIAHPDFRDELIKEAEKQNIWRRTNKIL